MAVSIANYPQTSETSNLVSVTEFNDDSLASLLPQQRLPIFETAVVVPQQNGSVTNKNILPFNSKRNSFPRSVPRNSSSTLRHSMCGDLPSQQINRNSDKSSSVKIRRRAASFGENSVVRNNNNNNSLTTTVTAEKSLIRKPITPLIINIPSKVDKIGSTRSSPRSPKISPKEKPSPKEKSSPEYSLKSSTMQHHHIEQKHEILDSNYNNQDELSSDKNHNFSTDYVQKNQNQNNNNNIENNNIQNPQLIKLQSQSQSQLPHNRAFFRHTITLNNNAGGSSTDLRKSMYKEPSFTKKLRKVFSLSNIRQDDNNSVSNSRFSSLRIKRNPYNSDDNNNDDDDTSVSSVSSNSDNNNNNKSRRKSFIDFQSFFSSNFKNEKKYKKQDRHQKRHQSHLEQQKKRSEDNKRDNSMDEMRGNDNINKEIQRNGNDYERIDDDSVPIPLQLSSLQSSDDNDSQHLQRQNSTSPLQNPFHINKSENIDERKNDSPASSPSRPFSLPASENKEIPSPTTPRRLSVPALKSSNSGINTTHSVPSLVLLRDTDIPPTSSTPSSMKKLQFSSTILIHETWTRDDYDRRGDQTTCNKLTPILAQRIKQELNDYKMDEMQVHEDSKNNTHFFAA